MTEPPHFSQVHLIHRDKHHLFRCWRLIEKLFLHNKNEWHSLSLHCLLSLNYLRMLHLSQQKGSTESSQLPHNSNFYYCFKFYSDQGRKSAHLAWCLQPVHNFAEKQTANSSDHRLSSHLNSGQESKSGSEPDSEELRDSLVIVIGKVFLISQPHLQDVTTTICYAENPDFYPSTVCKKLESNIWCLCY